MLRWDGIAVFPNASKLAKLLFVLAGGAAVTDKGTDEYRCGGGSNGRKSME